MVVMCENDSITIYEWDERKVVEEFNNFVEEMSAMTSAESQLCIGTQDGCLQVFN